MSGTQVQFDIFKISRRRGAAFLLFAALFALVIWWVNNQQQWYGMWDKFYTYSDIESSFCEKIDLKKVVRQPINTFSNIVYLIFGLAIIRRGWKDQSKRNRYNIISANPFYSITYGFILLYTFAASTFFHSSLLIFANRLDFSAVYSLSLFPLMYFTHRVWLMRLGLPSNTRHYKSMWTLIVLFTALYIALTFFIPDGTGKYVVLGIIACMITFGVLVERADPGKTNRRYLTWCIASLLFAVMWFAFDVYKILCEPESIIQPHSLWHLFAGIAAFYFYMYIRSERNKL